MIILSVIKIKRIILFLLILLAFYTRFAGLDWGLPYPFHPDERNMALAVQQLNCDSSDLRNCFNPRFFAYGQPPLYAAFLLTQAMKFFDGDLFTPVSFQEAAFALRLISAFASVVGIWLMWKIVETVKDKKSGFYLSAGVGLLFIFSPALIQAAHFGTTESLLMMLFLIMNYLGLKFVSGKISLGRFIFFSGLVGGLAVATKISAVVFLAVPVYALSVKNKFYPLFKFALFTLFFFVIFSPHNLLSLNEFLGSMRYESAVALGTEKVFYTRQFEQALPVLFQLQKVFPYALGLPVLLLFLAGFFTLPFNKRYNFLRFAFLIYFLPAAFLYAKWTRFMTPVTPLMIIFAVLTLFVILNSIEDLLSKIRFRNKFGMTTIVIFIALISITIIPGIAYLSIYQHPDVRVTTSRWINENIPENSNILSETANVVDIPVESKHSYQYTSFNFYDLDREIELQNELTERLSVANYIFVPSRRLFTNHDEKKYPKLNNYYRSLFSGELGFTKIVEFSSYPKITFLGKTLIEFPDERSEETWTVFDHPVVRIYEKNNSL